MKIQICTTVVITFITGCQSWYLFYCPEEFKCHNVYNGPFAVPFCEYYCCVGSVWLSGLYPEGTPCWAFLNPGLTGTCSRGICIPPKELPVTTERLPVYPTPEKPTPSCDGYYRGLGYATNCTYSCRFGTKDRNRPYRNGTPCLNVSDGSPQGKPGICTRGECVKIGNMTSEYKHPRIYPRVFKQCPDKFHNEATFVPNCNYYCKIGGDWFYGNYTLNTRCHDTNGSGWCCRGKCNEHMWCQDKSNIPTHDKVTIFGE